MVALAAEDILKFLLNLPLVSAVHQWVLVLVLVVEEEEAEVGVGFEVGFEEDALKDLLPEVVGFAAVHEVGLVDEVVLATKVVDTLLLKVLLLAREVVLQVGMVVTVGLMNDQMATAVVAMNLHGAEVLTQEGPTVMVEVNQDMMIVIRLCQAAMLSR